MLEVYKATHDNTCIVIMNGTSLISAVAHAISCCIPILAIPVTPNDSYVDEQLVIKTITHSAAIAL